MKQSIQILTRSRLLAGETLNTVEALIESGKMTPEKSAELAADINLRMGVIAGIVFALREALPADQFVQAMARIGIDKEELNNHLETAAK